MEQSQRQDVVQLLRVHQEAAKDVDVRLVAFTPVLQRAQVIEIPESKMVLGDAMKRDAAIC